MPSFESDSANSQKRVDLVGIFRDQQEILKARLGQAKGVSHPTASGEEGEESWLSVIKSFLPNRYAVVRGCQVVDAHEAISDQQDIVIYDALYAPKFLVAERTTYIPVESVYAVFEVRTQLNKENVEYAGEKAASVRSLRMSPGEFGVLNNSIPVRREPHYILAGILCRESEGAEPFGGRFKELLAAQSEYERLDLGCVASAGAFSRLAKEVATAPPDKALIAFSIALFDALQKVGNATAVNAIQYAAGLWETDA